MPEPSASTLLKNARREPLDTVGTNRISNLQKSDSLAKFQLALEGARKFRDRNELRGAESAYIQILEGRAPEEIKRTALFELAQVMQGQKGFAKAQQLYAEYIRRYATDPAVPEILLRQAYLYRDMGIHALALSKFYAVISSCLNLKLETVDYYQKLVLRAQVEIAETYFLEGKHEEAIEYFKRVLHLDDAESERSEVLYKLVRSFSALGKYTEAETHARAYLQSYPDHIDAAETEFLLASALKKAGKDKEAVEEITLLLQKQHLQSKSDPQQWLYWQQRAGNEIGNQFYRQGDFANALQVYQLLANLNSAPEWQIPVFYQIGLVYENLKQNEKASEMYERLLAREKEAKTPSAGLKQVAEMAAWRKGCISWEAKARIANQQFQSSDINQDAL